MDSQKNMTESIQDTNKHFFNGESVKLSNGEICSSFMVNAEKWGVKVKKWGRCQLGIA